MFSPMFFSVLRRLILFVIAAGVGALLALAVRSAFHRPYDVSLADVMKPAQPLTASV